MDFAELARERVAGPDRAGIGLRLGAWALDAFLQVVITFALGLLLNEYLWVPIAEHIVTIQFTNLPFDLSTNALADTNGNAFDELVEKVGWVVCGTWVALLYGLTELAGTQTPGKLISTVRIAAMDGTKPSFKQKLIRYTLKHGAPLLILLSLFVDAQLVYVAIFYFNVYLVESLSAGGSHCLAGHDRISRTTVLTILPH